MVLKWTFFHAFEADIFSSVEKRGYHFLFATFLGDVVGDFLGLFNQNLSTSLWHFATREHVSSIASLKLSKLEYYVKRDLKVAE